MHDYQKLYHTVRWRKLRKRLLFEHPRCHLCLIMNRQTPSCDVDHVIPNIGSNEDFFDESNLVPICRSCHGEKTYYETYKSRKLPNNIRMNSSDVTLLFGPTCSGKTTYANTQECTVIDFDEIKKKISGQNPYEMDGKYLSMCYAIRNKLIQSTRGKMIVIGTLANPIHREDWLRKLKAKPLLMITPMSECIKRLKETDRPNKGGQIALIKRWFQEFTPLGNESFVK